MININNNIESDIAGSIRTKLWNNIGCNIIGNAWTKSIIVWNNVVENIFTDVKNLITENITNGKYFK